MAPHDDAVSGRYGELCAELEHHGVIGNVRLEIPVCGVERLPHAAEIGRRGEARFPAGKSWAVSGGGVFWHANEHYNRQG